MLTKQCRLALFVILLACACAFVFACGKTSPSDGTPVVTNYATEILSLPATARDHWQIYQVNPKLYGNSGAFGKIQARLDDIKALGTDFFYLMPIYAEGKKNAIGPHTASGISRR